MNDPRRHERFSPPLAGPGSSEPDGTQGAPPADPAYADQASYAATYGGPVSPWARNADPNETGGSVSSWAPNADPNETGGSASSWAPNADLNETAPTKGLPTYWQQDPWQQDPDLDQSPQEGSAPPPPQGSKTPRWLWIAAGAAVLLVVGLLIALVLANGALKTQTAVPPLPAMPGPTSAVPTPSTRKAPPSASAAPLPPTSVTELPTETTAPAGQSDVVYTVNGEGRAISIMYLDTGDVIQTEFNVALPWSKQVSLTRGPTHSASVTIVNIGHNVTCSVAVGGVQQTQREGVGLTICDAKT
jgi:Mycobacterium membrane protein